MKFEYIVWRSAGLDNVTQYTLLCCHCDSHIQSYALSGRRLAETSKRYSVYAYRCRNVLCVVWEASCRASCHIADGHASTYYRNVCSNQHFRTYIFINWDISYIFFILVDRKSHVHPQNWMQFIFIVQCWRCYYSRRRCCHCHCVDGVPSEQKIWSGVYISAHRTMTARSHWMCRNRFMTENETWNMCARDQRR